jgi:hypothetical protein
MSTKPAIARASCFIALASGCLTGEHLALGFGSDFIG